MMCDARALAICHFAVWCGGDANAKMQNAKFPSDNQLDSTRVAPELIRHDACECDREEVELFSINHQT